MDKIGVLLIIGMMVIVTIIVLAIIPCGDWSCSTKNKKDFCESKHMEFKDQGIGEFTCLDENHEEHIFDKKALT